MRETSEMYARNVAWLQHEMLQCGQLVPDEGDDWDDPSQDGSLAALFEGNIFYLASIWCSRCPASPLAGCFIQHDARVRCGHTYRMRYFSCNK